MSIFSHIRKSRQQAKEHNAKLAEQQKKEKQETMSYRHVPTHAASDAFASAPPTWREAADRPRIIEENRRRSAMGVNGSHTNMPGPNFPRVASGLSYVSYPGQENPRARMPRTYSYTGISPYPDSSRAIIHSIPNVAQFEPPCLKQDSPSESNSVSAGSQEDLAMRNYRNPIVASTASETVHRLHPSSRSRRTSDASIDRRSMSNSANHKSSPSTSRDSRPPPSTRGFNALPPSAILVPMQPGAPRSSLPTTAIAPTMRDPRRSSTDSSSRRNSSSSLAGRTPNSTNNPSPSTLVTPSPSRTPTSDFYLNAGLENGADTDGSSFTEPTARTAGVPPRKSIDQSGHRVTRFREVESPVDNGDMPGHVPPAAFHAQVVNFLPEPMAPDSELTESKKNKGKKASKGGVGRLLKKNR